MAGLLQDKRILVTGGASGIGRAAVRLFLDEGARVFVSDLSVDPEPDARVAGFCKADVTKEAECEAAATDACRALGKLDGLFHCAGIADRVSPAEEIEIEAWQKIVDVTLRGTFLMARAVGRHLKPHGGSVVTVASINGIGGFPRRHAYGPAKAGVALLTKSLACEWGASGIRVNAIAPGYIQTPMVAGLLAGGRIDGERIVDRTPLGRLGQPDEVGKAAAFLLSDLASYVSGAVLPVDGGWTAFGGAGAVATA